MPDRFAEIETTLSDWGELNGVEWFRTYQDLEVRTYFLSALLRSRVQTWVDPPEDGRTTVHVSQQAGGARTRRSKAISTPVDSLAVALDQALVIAAGWNAEAD